MITFVDDTIFLFLQSAEKSKEGDQVRKEVTKDLSSMSEREKLEIFHQENPEFASLVEEFRGLFKISNK